MRRVLALALLPALPAQAAVQPCHLDRMVAEAPNVIQVVDHAVGGPDAAGACTLAGTVARSFRGDLAPGALVETTFACANPDGLVGGTIYHEAREIVRAGAVELHLGAEGGPAGYGWGLLPLDAATEKAAFRFEHLGAC